MPTVAIATPEDICRMHVHRVWIFKDYQGCPAITYAGEPRLGLSGWSHAGCPQGRSTQSPTCARNKQASPLGQTMIDRLVQTVSRISQNRLQSCTASSQRFTVTGCLTDEESLLTASTRGAVGRRYFADLLGIAAFFSGPGAVVLLDSVAS